MALVECRSAQPHIPSVWVDVAGISDGDVAKANRILDRYLTDNGPADGVAGGFAAIVELCPRANPSDLWLQVVYRHLMASGWNDNRWKRVSGFALERALVQLYAPRMATYGLRMVQLPAREAEAVFQRYGVNVASSKADLFLERRKAGEWSTFGVAHVKASIAERIQDDVPASVAIMNAGLVSIILTMDAKCFPPPHGDCINYGELGGRSVGIEKQRIKREYIEVHGQFDGLFSFNLRTPESPPSTHSGKRIQTMSLTEPSPDTLVRFLLQRWNDRLGPR